MIIHEHMLQGSEQWLAIRKGRATASEASKILTSTGKTSTQALGYMRKLARETFCDDPMEWTGNKFTDWGNEHEADARELFESKTKLQVAQVGFCNRADNAPIGCSPDGLIVGTTVSTHGFAAGLELKCPQVDTHVGYVLDGVLPTEYKMQVHWSMAVTGLREWWFMSYFPQLNPLILKVTWDSFTDAVVKAQDDFVRQYAAELVRVRQAVLPRADKPKPAPKPEPAESLI
jgi:putative phage-type endonuclease